ncbi:MAG: DUF177 domain-containing protein [Clostridia bacterium]|nr:DUF177 domain-containing protein [Clostridia bacterium]
MFIELEPIFNNLGEELSFEYELDLSECEYGGVFPFKAPVMVKGVVKNTAGIVEMNANVKVFYDGFCDRCAESVKREFDFDFSHTLVSSLNNEENDELMLIEDMRFELDSLITEDVFLSLPTKILCSDDCKGLCSRCGANLNLGACGCRKEIDPRLAALKELLEK